YARQILTFDPERLRRPQPYADENHIEFGFERLQRHVRANLGIRPEFYSKLANQTDLLFAIHRPELVLSHAIGIEPARSRPRFEHGNGVTLATPLGRAGERCRTPSNAGDAPRPLRAGRELRAMIVKIIHGVALQTPDLD